MLTIIVRAARLKAVSLAMSSEETRFYLKGIAFERNPVDGRPIMVATDGHMLLAHRGGWYLGEAPAETPIVPADKVAAILKAAGSDKRDRTAWVCFRFEPDSRRFVAAVDHFPSVNEDHEAGLVGELFKNGVTVCGETIDGTFPDWRRVVPAHNEGAAIVPAFNGALLATMAKAAAIVADGGLGIIRVSGAGPEDAARIAFPTPDLVGVVMPIRSDCLDRCDWLEAAECQEYMARQEPVPVDELEPEAEPAAEREPELPGMEESLAAA